MRFFSRRFRPLLFALGCWLLVLLVPATRQGLAAAWSNRFGAVQEGDENQNYPLSFNQKSVAKALLKRFSSNKAVEIYAAQQSDAAAKLLERYPQDLLVITLALRQQIAKLDSDRNEGPLTNPNYPAPPSKTSWPDLGPPSPRADWNRFLALARRGQRLEPNNSYFDWMLLYALYATRQDEAARAVLAQAARKTAYDDHVRDAILNRRRFCISPTAHRFRRATSPRCGIRLGSPNTAKCARPHAG